MQCTQRWAAQLLRVAGKVGADERTVRGWIECRELKSSTLGTRIGKPNSRRDVEAFLDRRTRTGAIAARLLRGTMIAPAR